MAHVWNPSGRMSSRQRSHRGHSLDPPPPFPHNPASTEDHAGRNPRAVSESIQSTPAPAPERLTSLDAYRGFVMLLMVSGGLGFGAVAEHFPDSNVWAFLDHQVSHVEWVGCTLWDLIQPSFMFMVGVALPYSVASRKAKGQTPGWMFVHTVYRALVLVLLGIFLRSNGRDMTNFTFEDVLTQIGLGYVFVYLLVGTGWKIQAGALAAVLVGYWAAFLLYPLPGPDFDYAAVGTEPGFGGMTGFFLHWGKNTNLAAAFDQWFLNLFPRSSPFVYNGGGYQTLSFFPSMGTMILGLIAGERLRNCPDRKANARFLFAAAAICLVAGWVAGMTVCPIVKRIWTPSWAVFAAGWTFALLGAFYWLIDIAQWKRWAFPLVVVGMNSIAMYVMNALWGGWIVNTLKTHISQDLFAGTYGPIAQRLSLLLILWAFCYWMYRKKLFIRI